jgi:hypothetical protein
MGPGSCSLRSLARDDTHPFVIPAERSESRYRASVNLLCQEVKVQTHVRSRHM